MEEQSRIIVFAGTTRRLFAFGIDLIILNLIFGIIWLILWFTSYNYSEIWIIFLVVFILYFTFGDSNLFNSQTPGKRLLHIQLIYPDNKTIDIAASFIRAVYIAFIYFFWNISLLLQEILSKFLYDFIVTGLIILIIGTLIGGATVFVAFHPFKQGFHDTIRNTLVVVEGSFDEKYLLHDRKYIRIFSAYFFTIIFVIVFFVFGIILKYIISYHF